MMLIENFIKEFFATTFKSWMDNSSTVDFSRKQKNIRLKPEYFCICFPRTEVRGNCFIQAAEKNASPQTISTRKN
jgi:hypothetical protein